MGLDLINNPSLAATTDVGIRIAGYMWNSKKPSLPDPISHGLHKKFTLNQLADRHDVYHISRAINGGTNGLLNRITDTGVALKVLTDLAAGRPGS